MREVLGGALASADFFSDSRTNDLQSLTVIHESDSPPSSHLPQPSSQPNSRNSSAPLLTPLLSSPHGPVPIGMQ